MPKDWIGPERRRAERTKINFIVSYHEHKPFGDEGKLSEKKQGYALMLDLSETGISILTKSNIPVATILAMQCALIDASVPGEIKQTELGEIKGEVCNACPTENNKYRIGIRFTQITEKDKHAIVKFLKHQNKS